MRNVTQRNENETHCSTGKWGAQAAITRIRAGGALEKHQWLVSLWFDGSEEFVSTLQASSGTIAIREDEVYYGLSDLLVHLSGCVLCVVYDEIVMILLMFPVDDGWQVYKMLDNHNCGQRLLEGIIFE